MSVEICPKRTPHKTGVMVMVNRKAKHLFTLLQCFIIQCTDYNLFWSNDIPFISRFYCTADILGYTDY